MANPLISAHRGGDDTPPAGTGPRPRPNSIAAVASAAALGADLIEIDVHLHHGVAKLGHDSVDDLSPTLAQAIEALGDRAALHLDIKSGDANCAVVDQAVRALGIGRLIVTTNRDADVRAIRAWSGHHAPGLLVALSTSAPPPGRGPRARLVSLFPRLRIRRSGANVVAAHHIVARWWLVRWTARRGLPLLVWTVDADADLARWLRDDRVAIVTTNRPARALALRSAQPPI